MSIKLVTIDIDGTLLNEKRQITPEVNEAIQKAKAAGVYIVLCTGRPLPGVQAELSELELTTESDYVITYNGSLIQNVHTGEVIARYGLTLADYIEIEMQARIHGSHVHAINSEMIYTPNRNIGKYTVHEATLVQMPLAYRTPEEMTEDMALIKMMMIDEPDILNRVISELPDSFKEKYTTVKSTDFYYEILNKNASKGNALRTLADHLGIAYEDTMAIGDNENDLSMIEAAGLGVAVGNATDRVKEVADVTVATNDENGVAQAINDYVLK